MPRAYDFDEVGRIAAPGDNVAIAARRLDAGTALRYGGTHVALPWTVLEGHRFAIRPIAAGEPLRSWGLPFGHAIRPIDPGDYVCNRAILDALRGRAIDCALPPEANFADTALAPYHLDEEHFQPGVQVPPHRETRHFLGYGRGGGRGAGTRNYIVILGTTSRASGYAKALEERLRGAAAEFGTIDGIVAVAHTEGGGAGRPNNLELLLRTLAGFMIHPNVGAVLAADWGDGAVTNETLRRWMARHDYPLAEVPHRFLTLDGPFEADLERGAAIVWGWLPQVAATSRTPQSLAGLNLGLQCGGSDAFSGISGNPLAAWAAKEVIRYGGRVNLAETDELIGAEEYVLQKVRDLATAREFLAMVERFQERVRWHGHTAEGNPSGGNKLRGLYNIAIKSIGAARKRHPDLRLDWVVEYGERGREAGFYFMDSPGNDLESIAGQVASGCNLLYFVTGNGSITNFPFVPTIKIVTTSERYRLLAREMDVNAGAYLDGAPLDELGQALLDLTVEAASGARTVGERAGHAQVSIWRNWMQTGRGDPERHRQEPEPTGTPLPVKADGPRTDRTFRAIETASGYAADQIGLILPTSLCAGQIALRIAGRLNDRELGRDRWSRFVALPHTEGCGVSSGSSEELYTRTLLGYLLHPLVGAGLLLEHGCEKTHNDFLRLRLGELGVDPGRFGWASVQLDGGIDEVTQKVEDWFATALDRTAGMTKRPVGVAGLRLGLSSLGPVSDALAGSMALLTRTIVGAGGTVVVPAGATILSSAAYLDGTLAAEGTQPRPSLAYGQAVAAREAGLHVMAAPTDHWVETLTGLGATGVEIVLVHTAGRPVQGHRMIPVLQVSADAATAERYGQDLDLALAGPPSTWWSQLLELVLGVAGRDTTPRSFAQRNTDFQFTRGLFGVSL